MNNIFSNVLYIGPTSDFGGMGAVVNTYAKHINKIKLVSTSSENNKASKATSLLKVISKVNDYLTNDKSIQIIHIHSASKRSFLRKSILALLGKFHNKKIVFHIHSGAFDTYYANAGLFKIIIKSFLRNMDVVVCLSEEWKEFYLTTMKLSNVLVIGNPIEMHVYNGHNLNNRVLNLLFLGKICNEKGIFDLLEYLKQNSYYLNNQIRLTIGGNHDVSRLQSLLDEPIFNTNIHFCGWVEPDLKAKLFTECDVFILPSYFEGLPVSILEAMSYGKSVISTRVGGIPSIVKEGFNGWLINPGNFIELDAVLEQIFNQSSILIEYGFNSHTTAKKFSTNIVTQQLEHLYSSLLVP